MHIGPRDLLAAGQAAAKVALELQREGKGLSGEELALGWNVSLIAVLAGRSGINPADLGSPDLTARIAALEAQK